MSHITSLPPDMINELFQQLSYEGIITLCQTNKQFANYCHQHRRKIDNLLLQDLLDILANDPNSLTGVLSVAIYYDNTYVFEELMKKNAHQLNRLINKPKFLKNIGTTRNIHIVLFLLRILSTLIIINDFL